MTVLTSSFAAPIEAMLEWRSNLGYSRHTLTYPLANFDRYCTAHQPGQTILTRDLVTAWCQTGSTVEWPAYKGHAIREFGKYLQTVGVEAFVLPAGWISRSTPKLPRLFTDEELAAFFRATDMVTPVPGRPLIEYTVPVVYRLMLGCGLRPQEARRIRRDDIHLDDGILIIERSKRNKDRRVPVDAGLTGLLRRFDELADLLRPGRDFFFEDQPGSPFTDRWLRLTYFRCCTLAGGVAPGSTPYTLRHNYAARTLIRWVEQGRDLNVWLPYLSAFMGHVSYSSTAYYVHLLPERLAATGLTSASGIIPEVSR